MRVRAVVVDDEPPARALVREYLEEFPEVEVAAECGSGRQAVQVIGELDPDLVFLDVQMPGLNGFEVLERLPAVPRVVFCTAYDTFALRAFEAGAVDYLLKPYSRERFRKAVERLLRAHEADERREEAERVLSLLERVRARDPRFLERLFVRVGERVVPVPVEEISWVEAAGDYSRLHAGGRSYLCGVGIGALAERLDPARFVRVHRSAIIAVAQLDHAVSDGAGGFVAVLRDRTRVRVSRSYAARIRELVL